MKKYLISPFYLYIITFLSIFLIYNLGWSRLYPPLSFGLVAFFMLSFFIAFFFAALQTRVKPFKNVAIKESPYSTAVVLLIVLSFGIEFINNRGIPLFLILGKADYDYAKFGIKLFHPILATFTSFYAVYLFHQFISVKKLKIFLLFIITISMHILVYNRGAFIMVLTSSVFVFLCSIKRIKFKIYVYLFIIIAFLLFLFGIAGNLRISSGKTTKTNEFITSTLPNSYFLNSKIPHEYMWSYIYISSPLANLQNTILKDKSIEANYKAFICYELLPDFFSKKLVPILNTKEEKPILITKWLTAVSLFTGAYSTLGWFGLYFMFIYLMFILTVYIGLLKKQNDFFVTGFAILNTFVVYNAFDNMIFFSGLSFQLIYPLIHMYFFSKKNKVTHKI